MVRDQTLPSLVKIIHERIYFPYSIKTSFIAKELYRCYCYFASFLHLNFCLSFNQKHDKKDWVCLWLSIKGPNIFVEILILLNSWVSSEYYFFQFVELVSAAEIQTPVVFQPLVCESPRCFSFYYSVSCWN